MRVWIGALHSRLLCVVLRVLFSNASGPVRPIRCWYRRPERWTSSIDWSQLSRFFLKMETESSLRNFGVLNKNRTMMSRNIIITVLNFKRDSVNTKSRSEQKKAQCFTEGSLHCAGSLNSWHSAIITIMNLSPRGRRANLVFWGLSTKRKLAVRAKDERNFVIHSFSSSNLMSVNSFSSSA
jgi:hypothetical protein